MLPQWLMATLGRHHRSARPAFRERCHVMHVCTPGNLRGAGHRAAGGGGAAAGPAARGLSGDSLLPLPPLLLLLQSHSCPPDLGLAALLLPPMLAPVRPPILGWAGP